MSKTRLDPYEDEVRWQTIGKVGSVLLVVVHTLPETDYEEGRIISARRATSHERNSMKKESIELTKQQRAMLKKLEEMPDEQIDTTDIPEICGSDGWFSTSQLPTVIQMLKETSRSESNTGRQNTSRITKEKAIRVQNEIVKANGDSVEKKDFVVRPQRSG